MAPPTLQRPSQSIKQLAQTSVYNSPSAIGDAIKRAKRPVGSAVKRYRQLGRTLMDFLTDDDRADQRLADLANHYDAEMVEIGRQLQSIRLTDAKRTELMQSQNELEAYHDVLGRFVALYHTSRLPEYEFRRGDRSLTPMSLSGVRVPVTLNLTVNGMVDGRPASGGAIIQLSRSIPDWIRGAMAANVAALVTHGLDQQQPDFVSPLRRELCLCVEVPDNKVVWRSSRLLGPYPAHGVGVRGDRASMARLLGERGNGRAACLCLGGKILAARRAKPTTNATSRMPIGPFGAARAGSSHGCTITYRRIARLLTTQ